MKETTLSLVIFSLRKGLATYTICKDCNETINCDKCLAPLVLYLSSNGKKRMFVCNKCNTEKDPETKCPICKSWNLMPLGIGTDRVYEELKEKDKAHDGLEKEKTNKKKRKFASKV